MEAFNTRVVAADGAGIEQAAALLRDGEVVGMPTETVYGLAADALNPEAVDKIFAAKGRPGDNPLIVHIADLEGLAEVARFAPEEAYRLAEVFWPGPLTIILPRAEAIPANVSAGLDTVGVRMPSHPAARALIRAAGRALAAPSANRSGKPSPTTARHVFEDLQGRIPLILDGGATEVGIESTVLSLVGEPTVFRPGMVMPRQLEAALGRPVAVARQEESPADSPPSPGMKYRHYAPAAEVILVEGSLEGFCGYVNGRAEPGAWALCFEGEQSRIQLPCLCYGAAHDGASQAAALFSALRELDDRGAVTVFARSPGDGEGELAVYNRLLRAAAFHVIEV